MDPTSLQPILDLLGKITVAGGLFFILVGGYRKWWVWGYQLKDCQDLTAKAELYAAKLESNWVDRLKARDAELKAEIQEWKDSNRRTEDMLDRSLTLQEQRSRDQSQIGQRGSTP